MIQRVCDQVWNKHFLRNSLLRFIIRKTYRKVKVFYISHVPDNLTKVCTSLRLLIWLILELQKMHRLHDSVRFDEILSFTPPVGSSSNRRESSWNGFVEVSWTMLNAKYQRSQLLSNLNKDSDRLLFISRRSWSPL